MSPLFNRQVKLLNVTLLTLLGIQIWLWINSTESTGINPVAQITYSIPQAYENLKEYDITSLDETEVPPVICNVNIVDLNQDHKNEVLICDAQQHAITLGFFHNGLWQESKIAEDIYAPAKSFTCDFDDDGDTDILVADLGDIFPNNKHIGNVYLLENHNHIFKKRLLLSNLRRVADARAHDMNGDGLLDIVVSEFGHDFGNVLLFIQQPDQSFVKNTLLEGPGSIHCPIVDIDNDGDMDIATILSQHEEELWVLTNNGKGEFSSIQIHQTLNDEFGSAGLFTSDLNNDGFIDLILTHGDNLEEFYHYPQNHHGCIIFYNHNGAFTEQRVSSIPGCYSASIGDLTGDGQDDIVLASMVNNWNDPSATSISILIKDKNNLFLESSIVTKSIKFISTAIGDINHDGVPDLVAGGFSIQPPFKRTKRLSIWLGEK